jgi:surface protein
MSASELLLNNDNIHDMVEKYIAGDIKIRNHGSIGNWDVSKVTNMSDLFPYENFNEDISKWDVSNVTNMNSMFMGAENFNQPLDNWNVSKVRDMRHMFEDATNFNQSLNSWNVTNVTDMNSMFKRATSFNQMLNSWDVSNVTEMGEMFYGAIKFNQPLNNWDVSNVIDMSVMFADAKEFNQPLNNWNVSNVIDMSVMFADAKDFNQPLNNWNVSNVINMYRMFRGAIKFNQPLNNWIIGDETNTKDMFLGPTSMDERNKPRIIGQAEQRMPQIAEKETVNFSIENNCYDIINGEDIPIKKALEDENIVFVFYTNDIKKSIRVAVPIQAVIDAHKTENLKSYIIYPCIIVGTMRQDNIIDKSYFDIKKLTGFGDVIELPFSFNSTSENILIFKQSEERLVSTVSYDVLNGASYVGARHCQEGQGATVYKQVPYTLTSDPVGGRKIRKRFSTRKRVTRKRVTRKRVTRKRK